MEFYTFRRLIGVTIKSGLITLFFYGAWVQFTPPRGIPTATRNLFVILLGFGLIVYPVLVLVFRLINRTFAEKEMTNFSGKVSKGRVMTGLLRGTALRETALRETALREKSRCKPARYSSHDEEYDDRQREWQLELNARAEDWQLEQDECSNRQIREMSGWES